MIVPFATRTVGVRIRALLNVFVLVVMGHKFARTVTKRRFVVNWNASRRLVVSVSVVSCDMYARNVTVVRIVTVGSLGGRVRNVTPQVI